jgi:glutaredoxin
MADSFIASNRVARITFHTKPGCPLCDEALAEVQAARNQRGFALEVVNILESLETYERYKHQVPVVSVNGIEVFRYRLAAAALLQEIERSRTAH